MRMHYKDIRPTEDFARIGIQRGPLNLDDTISTAEGDTNCSEAADPIHTPRLLCWNAYCIWECHCHGSEYWRLRKKHDR